MFFLTLLYAVAASYIIGGLLATFPDDVAPDDSDPFKNPQSEPANPVPMIFGTRRVRGVNTLWYGALSYTEITKKVKAGWKSETVTMGYRYYIGMQMGIAYGFTGMVFKSLYIGEDLVYDKDSGSELVSGASETFSDVWLYGGDEKGGGVEGKIRFYNGVDDLAIAPLLYANLSSDPQLPHYKGLAQISLSNFSEGGGMYVGTSKQVRAVSVVVSNVAFFVGGIAPFSDGSDVNPITVLRHLLLTDSRLLSLSGGEIDLQSLDTAEQTIWDEGLLFSPIFSRAKPVEQMIEIILKFIDAVFYTDPLTGLLTLTLLREVTPTGNEITLDTSNVTKIVKTKLPDRSKNVNEIKLTFTDRRHNYENRTITSQDLAGYIAAGGVHITKVLSYPSICNIDIARFICDRDLMQLSSPVTTIELETKRILAATRIGDQIIVNLDEIGIVGEFFRVAGIDYGKLQEGTIKVTLVSDVYTGAISLYAKEPDTVFVDPIGVNNTVEATDAVPIELPRILLRRLVVLFDEETGLDTGWGGLMLVPNTEIGNLSFDIFVDDTLSGVYNLTRYESKFVPTSTLLSDWDRFDVIGTNYLDNTHRLQFTLPSIDLEAFSVTVADSQNQAEPERYAYLNGEWFMYTSLEDLGSDVYSLNDVRRGALDTPPKDHIIGDVIYFVSDVTPIVSASSFITADTPSVNIKINPKGLFGEVGIENIVGNNSLVSENRAALPLSVHWLQFSGVFYRTPYNKQTAHPLVITWNHHNRDSYNNNWLQGNVDDIEDLVSYTVNVYEADETTLIGTYPQIEGNTWEYTKAMEVSDHGVNSRILMFKITSIDSINGICLYPRFETVHFFDGFGFHFGQNFGH